MDNYNYYDKKISALEKKIGQLEALNQQVINDNNELKAKLSRERKSTHSIADRSLFPQIDQTIANFLFNYDVDPKTGIINTSASSARKNTNFTNFYRFILQVLKPRGKATLVQLLGTITEENNAMLSDDGFTQTVVVRKGIALKDNKAVNPIVSLKPFRTFCEVDQPESEFLIRLSEGGYVALYEADGGAWKLQARRNVADYLKAALADLIEAGEVIVVE